MESAGVKGGRPGRGNDVVDPVHVAPLAGRLLRLARPAVMACGILTAGTAACKPDYTIAPQPATVSPGQTVRFSVSGAGKVLWGL